MKSNVIGIFRLKLRITLVNLALAVGALTLPLGAQVADPLSTWYSRNPPAFPGYHQGITFANDMFVAVGTIISTSIDGESWISRSSGVSNLLSGVVYANGKFVAVGQGGAVLTSPDGASWTRQSSGTTASLADVTYANGLFIAVGERGVILTSTNGTNWVAANSGITTDLAGIGYGNGTFVAVGDGAVILTSANGINWTVRGAYHVLVSGHYRLNSVTFGNGRLVAVGTYTQFTDVGPDIPFALFATSTDNGVTWSSTRTLTSNTTLSGLTYGNNTFTAVGNTCFTSPDGATWTQQTTGAGNDVAYGNSKFVAVDLSKVRTSPDGRTWSLPGSVTTQQLCSIASGSSNLVAVGFGGTVLSSDDGIHWQARSSGTTSNLYSVAYGNGLFVAVGQIILSSPNGVTWTSRPPESGLSLETVAYVNGQFIAVGDNGSMRVSANGLSWSTRNPGTTANLYGIAYGNNLYVITGAGGLIRTSPNSVTWTTRSSGTSQDLNGVTYGNGLFVVQGNNGVILTSLNGTTWTARDSFTGQGLATSAYGATNFVIVGMQGTILSSTNGVNWQMRSPGVPALLLGVAYAKDTTFVTVGEAGTILQSDRVIPLVCPTVQSIRRSGNNVTLAWTAVSNQTYQVRYRTDLGHNNTVPDTEWSNLTPTITASGPTATYSDTNGVTTQRFYRILVLP